MSNVLRPFPVHRLRAASLLKPSPNREGGVLRVTAKLETALGLMALAGLLFGVGRAAAQQPVETQEVVQRCVYSVAEVAGYIAIGSPCLDTASVKDLWAVYVFDGTSATETAKEKAT